MKISSERVITDMLKGRMAYGPQLWPPRREAILPVLSPRHESGVVPLAINPTADTAIIRAAFESRWYYAQTPDGRVDRSRPKKPNSPWADVGHAAAYLLGWLRPGTAATPKPKGWKPQPAKGVVSLSPHGPLRAPAMSRAKMPKSWRATRPTGPA